MQYLNFIGTFLMGFLTGYFSYLFKKKFKKYENALIKNEALQSEFNNLSCKLLEQINLTSFNLFDYSSVTTNDEVFCSIEQIKKFNQQNEYFFNKKIKGRFRQIHEIFNLFSEIERKYFSTSKSQKKDKYGLQFGFDMYKTVNTLNRTFNKNGGNIEQKHLDKSKIQAKTKELRQILAQLETDFIANIR